MDPQTQSQQSFNLFDPARDHLGRPHSGGSLAVDIHQVQFMSGRAIQPFVEQEDAELPFGCSWISGSWLRQIQPGHCS